MNCLNFNDFPQFIKDLRSKENLSQEDLARKLNISVSTIRRWESGNYSIPATKSLIDICNVFHISLNELIGIKKENAINIESLTSEQQELLKALIIEFQHKKCSQNAISDRQSKIIHMLLSEFSK